MFIMENENTHLLKKAKGHVKEVPSIKFCYADINCCLKVKFNDEKQKDICLFPFFFFFFFLSLGL